MNFTPKELFNKNRDESNRLRAVTASVWFRQALFTCRAQLMNSGNMTQDMMKGALAYESSLLSLAEETDQNEVPIALLHHQIDNPASEKTEPKKNPEPQS